MNFDSPAWAHEKSEQERERESAGKAKAKFLLSSFRQLSKLDRKSIFLPLNVENVLKENQKLEQFIEKSIL